MPGIDTPIRNNPVAQRTGRERPCPPGSVSRSHQASVSAAKLRDVWTTRSYLAKDTANTATPALLWFLEVITLSNLGLCENEQMINGKPKAVLVAGAIALVMAGLQTPANAQSDDVATAFDMARCVNMGNSYDAPKGKPWGGPVNNAHFPIIRAAGFDTVRIPVRWSDYTGPGPDYTIDPAFLAEVSASVDAALAADLNVILNVHHFKQIMENPRGEMRRLLQLWRQIAPAFADRPDSLWFETLNEPTNNLEGDLMRTAQEVAVLAIRESNPDRIVILGGQNYSNIRTLDSNIAPPDKNIVYTFHYYDPFRFTHQGASWLGDNAPPPGADWGSPAERTQLSRDVKIATDFAAKVNRPVFLGEFGVLDVATQAQRERWTGAAASAFLDAGVPWCLWSFTNTFPIYDDDSGWNEGLLNALGLSPNAGTQPHSGAANNPETGATSFTTAVVRADQAMVENAAWGRFLTYFAGDSSATHDNLAGVAEIRAGEEIHPPHQHSEEEFLMVLEGSGTWTVGDTSFAANAGDLLYAAPWDLHGIKNTGDTTLKFVVWKWHSSTSE